MLLQPILAFGKWTVVDDRKITAFDMYTARLGLIATNDAARVLGRYDNGHFLGVFVPNGEITSVQIVDEERAYISVKGDGVYESAGGWRIWTKVYNIADGFVIGADSLHCFIRSGNNILVRRGGTITTGTGLIADEPIQQAVAIHSQLAFCVSQHRLYRSFDGGETWNLIRSDLVRSGSLYFDKHNGFLYIGGKNPLRSADSGRSFTEMKSIFFFSISGQIFGTRDCSGAFYLGPDSLERIEMFRSTTFGKFIQEVGSGYNSSYRLIKAVVLDRGSTMYWLDKTGYLAVSRDGVDGTIPESIADYIQFERDSSITGSMCNTVKPTSFKFLIRYKECVSLKLDSLKAAANNPAFTFSFSPVFIRSVVLTIPCTFKARKTGLDSIDLILYFHSTLTDLPETKRITLYGEGYADAPIMEIDKPSIDFGLIKAGKIIYDTIRFSNNGCDTLRIDTLESSYPALFQLDTKKYPIIILPQRSVELSVGFRPTEAGDFLESIRLRSNVGNQYLTLRGSAYTDPVIRVRTSPAELIRLYPNPVTKLFNVESPADVTAEIYDMTGKSVQSLRLLSGKNEIDISNYPSGFYLITIGTQHYRFVKR
jgi:hypothetical protein